MPAENGRKMRIELGDASSPPTYTALAGAREESFTLEVGEIDITDKDSNERRELLEGGIHSLSLSVSGITKDRSQLIDVVGKIKSYRVTWSNGDQLVVNAQLGSFSETGSHENSAVTFTGEFRSSGDYTFTAA